MWTCKKMYRIHLKLLTHHEFRLGYGKQLLAIYMMIHDFTSVKYGWAELVMTWHETEKWSCGVA